MAYKIDYLVDSSTIGGTKNKGSVYIRGCKGENGIESFKFVLEKNVDFNDLDSKMVLNAIEHAMKQQPEPVTEDNY